MEIVEPPRAPKRPRSLFAFNDKRIDNYYWLNERDNPEVIAYLQSENNYLERSLEPLKTKREEILKEMEARIVPSDQSEPYFQNDYWYYSRFEDSNEHPIHCRSKKSDGSSEEIVLDVNELAKGKNYYEIEEFEVSDDNSFVAFAEDNTGRKQLNLRFKDINRGKILEEQFFGVSDSFAWTNDSKAIVYIIKDNITLRPYKVMLHQLGNNPVNDTVMFEEKDTAFELDVQKTKSGQYILVSSESTDTSEHWLINADEPERELILIEPRKRGHEYFVDEYNYELYILTNHEASNFRLMRAHVSAPGKTNWTEIIPHSHTLFWDDFDVFKDFVALTGYRNGLAQICIFNLKNLTANFVSFPERSYSLSLENNFEPESSRLRFNYSSLVTPNIIYEADMETLEKRVLKQDEVPGYRSYEYTTDMQRVKSRDNVFIPVSLAYKKGMVNNGNNPVLMDAYGAYGISNDPEFDENFITLMDRGFIIAFVHVRGGHEMGSKWYENGKLLNKRNTFFDFIDCAEYLIAEKYTNPKKLFAQGMSAGGLLVGAVMNMRPELWNSVIANVPFVDVLTTMLDETLPLTSGEYSEWGNPKDPNFYYYIKGYSPYDTVADKKYPALFVSASFPDSQVQYWEPAKWVARIRDHNQSTNPVYLYTDMHASHYGKSGRYSSLELLALQYTFMIWRAGAEVLFPDTKTGEDRIQ